MSYGLAITDYAVFDELIGDGVTRQLPTLGFMYYFIKGKRNSYFELGAGLSSSIRLDLEYSYLTAKDEQWNGSPLNLHGVIGYRYQKPEGFVFRVGFTPYYNLRNFPLPIIGLSFGYSF